MTLDLMPDPDPPKARNISNSEVTCFLSCKRMYEFAFMQELAPIETSVPLARGSVGHHYLELYWKARMESIPHAEAMAVAEEAFINPCENMALDKLMETQFIATRFLTNMEERFANWRPLGVEEKFDLPVTPQLNMTIKYDLYYHDLVDNKKRILDWKFSYDWWTDDDHDLNGQMPKYILVMQANGYEVHEGQLAEIRTRKLGPEKSRDARNLWRFTRYNPSNAKKHSVLRQHVAASLEIERFRALDDDERRIAALPVLNKHGACKFCNFKDLCNSMNEGRTDLRVDIRTNYRQSDYGYNKDAADFLEIL